MGVFLQDLRFATRTLGKRRGFSLVVILLLALGIGANTAMFGIVDAVILKPLPFRDPQRLVAIWESTRNWDPKIFTSYRDLEEWRQRAASFDGLAGYRWYEYAMTGAGAPRRILGVVASPNFFSLVGVPAMIGRTFSEQDLRGPRVAVVSAGLWRSQFGAAPDIAGKSVTLDQKTYTIVGVMPPEFVVYPKQTEIWTPLDPDADFLQANPPKVHSLCVVGRLKPDANRVAAADQLVSIRRGLEKKDPEAFADVGVVINGLQEEWTWLAGNKLRPALLTLMAAVGLVLLIACANVANLLIGRSAERRKEMAVRLALGSGRARLVRQLLTESLLLAALGAALGTLLAYGGIRVFNAASPVELPPGNAVLLDARVLAFTAAIAVLTALLFGLLPAWQGSRADVNDALKGAGSGVFAGGTRNRASSLLVVSEIALSIVLLISAGLTIESFLGLRAVAPGFRIQNLLSADVELREQAYPEHKQIAAFIDRAIERLRAIHGVRSSAIAAGRGLNVLTVEGQPEVSKDKYTWEPVHSVTAGYFETMGIPLLEGRTFDERDREGSLDVAIVSRELVRRFFPHENPVGKHVRIGVPEEKLPWLTIVGVVGDTRRTDVFNDMTWKRDPEVYVPYQQRSVGEGRWLTIELHGEGDQKMLADAVRSAVLQVDPALPLNRIQTGEEAMYESVSRPRFRARLLGVFAGLALLLAAVGLYGVLSQSTLRRRREIGIRMAVGATGRDIRRLVLGRGAGLALVGIGIGLAGAALAGRLLRSFLYGVSATDPMTYAGVSLMMLAVACLASLLPARRASRVDPISALRHE